MCLFFTMQKGPGAAADFAPAFDRDGKRCYDQNMF
jgi:hypothetical protein